VKAVVLVGGEGTRLRPLTYTTPKPLLPIANQPFLERQLEWLAAHGVDEVVLSLGYLPDAFETQFPGARFGDLELRYAVEDHPLGTAGAIRFAAEGITERLIVCNGDVLTTLDLDALVAFHDVRGAEATIHLTQVVDPSAFGVVPTRDDGEVVAFVEKPPTDVAPTNWINAGTYVLEPSVLERIPERLAVSIERETFPRMLEEPRRLYAMASDDYWIDIGTPEKYLQAHADVLAGALGARPAPGARELTPGVWIQGEPDIDDSAEIVAPALIGNGCIIGAGARIAESVVGSGVVLGAGARLLRSVVHDDVLFGEGAEACDSVIGARAVLGAGAMASDQTIIGADATLGVGARASGARIRRPEPAEVSESGEPSESGKRV
jgi:NDP-sugar pyrophosphorylase family protein